MQFIDDVEIQKELSHRAHNLVAIDIIEATKTITSKYSIGDICRQEYHDEMAQMHLEASKVLKAY